MRPLAVFTGAILTVLMLGCRSDSGATPSSTNASASSSASAAPAVHILLEVDTSSLQSEDVDVTLQQVGNVMRERVLKFGGYDFRTASEGPNRLSFQFKGVTSTLAAKLLGRRAFLDLREPVLANDGKVLCVSDTGQEFTVPVLQVVEEERCDSAGATGRVKWQPASAGSGQRVTSLSIREASYHEQDNKPFVNLKLNNDDGLAFQEITSRLVGYPLAIFVDDQLLTPPRVNAPIESGAVAIEGLSFEDARVLAAQLVASDVPVHIRIIQMGDLP